jgi:hypothetical protein
VIGDGDAHPPEGTAGGQGTQAGVVVETQGYG